MGTHLWIFPPAPPPSSPAPCHRKDVSGRHTHTHTGSSAGKAKEKLRKAMLHLSNNTRIMQFHLADFTRGFPHPSASYKPVGQIKASGAHPFPSGTEGSRGVAVLTQKEKEQSGDKAGFSWWSTAGLSSLLHGSNRGMRAQVLPLFPRKTASLVAAPLPSILPHNIPKISIISIAGFPTR